MQPFQEAQSANAGGDHEDVHGAPQQSARHRSNTQVLSAVFVVLSALLCLALVLVRPSTPAAGHLVSHSATKFQTPLFFVEGPVRLRPKSQVSPSRPNGMMPFRTSKPSALYASIADPAPTVRTKEEIAKAEFELNRGQAVDVLLADYPVLFDKGCDFSIFSSDILLEDVQGYSVAGMVAYRAWYSVVSSLIKVPFQPMMSATLMDKYGIDKGRIKIRWKLNLYPRDMGISGLRDAFRWFDTNNDGVISKEELATGEARMKSSGTLFRKEQMRNVDPVVIEGISIYTLNRLGKIYMHKIEVTSPIDYPLLQPLRELVPVGQRSIATNGIPTCFSWAGCAMLRLAHAGALSSPAGSSPGLPTPNVNSQFQYSTSHAQKAASEPERQSWAGAEDFLQGMADSGSTGTGDAQGEMVQQFMQAFGGRQIAEQLGFKLPKTCETDYDCNEGGYNWPLICANFIIAKFCIDPDDNISGGLGANAFNEAQFAPEYIPIPVEDFPRYPPGTGNGGYPPY